MAKVYLVFVSDSLEGKPLEEASAELEKKGVGVTFCRMEMPTNIWIKMLEFEKGE